MEVRGVLKGTYHLEQSPFKTGGEGSVYAIKGEPSMIVKIYNDKANKKVLEDKLAYMLNKQPNKGILTQIAWPVDLVYDQAGCFAGFVMNRLDTTHTLNDIYVYPPTKSISFRNKLIIAQNICRIIREVHSAGYIFGDFNPQNIGVNLNNGTVAFFDTDSYHIVLDRTSGKAFRCNVCAPGYAAPELLKKCNDYICKHPEHSKCAYEKTPLDTFTQETDNFALGIHMFKLMNNGYSPFCGINSSSNGSASIASPGVGDEAVWKDNYCFKSSKMPISEAVPPFDTHPDYVRNMFTRAFVNGKRDPGNRPSADEWHKALVKYENELVTCGKSRMHMYRKGLSDCPWCNADAKFKARMYATKPANAYASIIQTPASPPPVQAAAIAAPNNSASNAVATSYSHRGNSLTANKRTSRVMCPNFKLSIAELFLFLGWAGFIASIVYILKPIVRDGSVNLTQEVLVPLDMIKNSIVCSAGLFLLCLGRYYSKYAKSVLPDIVCRIWCLISCVVNASIYYAQHGFNAKSASNTWKVFGMLLLFCAAFLYTGTALGEFLAKRRNNKNTLAKVNHCFGIDEILLSAIMLMACIISILALMNLGMFYNLISQYKYAIYLVDAIPAFVFYLYRHCPYHGKTTEAWFCASMAGTLTLVMLTLSRLTFPLTLVVWTGMILLLIYIGSYINGSFSCFLSGITPTVLGIIFFAGTYVAFKSHVEGLSSVGAGARWWIAAPAIAVSVLAILPTIREIAGY